eukprot:TRINITY_DN1171_c0_g2_i2.p1 TRINITY_DN1171_c0_g2~~TRINITY_DN1171_c0_g2_i2.p1  ORF type:complete len:541 (+),score=130.24 TRINITY_DN1171_c0_g2_i2:2270-3892(+)
MSLEMSWLHLLQSVMHDENNTHWCPDANMKASNICDTEIMIMTQLMRDERKRGDSDHFNMNSGATNHKKNVASLTMEMLDYEKKCGIGEGQWFRRDIMKRLVGIWSQKIPIEPVYMHYFHDLLSWKRLRDEIQRQANMSDAKVSKFSMHPHDEYDLDLGVRRIGIILKPNTCDSEEMKSFAIQMIEELHNHSEVVLINLRPSCEKCFNEIKKLIPRNVEKINLGMKSYETSAEAINAAEIHALLFMPDCFGDCEGVVRSSTYILLGDDKESIVNALRPAPVSITFLPFSHEWNVMNSTHVLLFDTEVEKLKNAQSMLGKKRKTVSLPVPGLPRTNSFMPSAQSTNSSLISLIVSAVDALEAPTQLIQAWSNIMERTGIEVELVCDGERHLKYSALKILRSSFSSVGVSPSRVRVKMQDALDNDHRRREPVIILGGLGGCDSRLFVPSAVCVYLKSSSVVSYHRMGNSNVHNNMQMIPSSSYVEYEEIIVSATKAHESDDAIGTRKQQPNVEHADQIPHVVAQAVIDIVQSINHLGRIASS